MSKVILVGGFHEIIELCDLAGVEILGIIDSIESEYHNGIKVLGSDDDAGKIFKQYPDIPAIITPDSSSTRKRLSILYGSIGFKFYTLISPKAIVSKSAKIGTGVVIQSGVNISASVEIKDFVKVNSLANIMHESMIYQFTTIAPNAILLGKVLVSEESYIGANSAILPNKSIGSNSTVGAGAVVTKDVPQFSIVAGNPAKVLKQFNSAEEIQRYFRSKQNVK
jgi:sugar O-acyltransferase (sialic acid O-acetyltransferase NeuD family)